VRPHAVECVVDARAGTGEGPLWSVAEQALYWVDIRGQRLHRYDPATGVDVSWPAPGPVACLGLCRDGTLIAAVGAHLLRFDPITGAFSRLVEVERDRPGNRLNDGRCDPAGRFWVGSMRELPVAGAPTGSLYRCTSAGADAMVDDLVVSNGLAFAPDGRTAYLSDSHASVRTIWRFAYDVDDGTLHDRRVFVDTRGLCGRPDGAAIDAAGCYWMAAIDGWALLRFTPDGDLDRTIPLPVGKPTMPAFGGADLRTIFVTSIRPVDADLREQPLAGGLFAVRVDVGGLPEPYFADPGAPA
jgi:sugar lactone lactonase YvrE